MYVELPQVGAKLAKGESFGCVESVKSSSDVYTPVSGEVIEANSALNDDPSLINQSPYGDGWMIKVKLDDQAEMDSLLDQDAYQKEISS